MAPQTATRGEEDGEVQAAPAGLGLQRVVGQHVGVEIQRLGVLQELDAVPLRPAAGPRVLRLC